MTKLLLFITCLVFSLSLGAQTTGGGASKGSTSKKNPAPKTETSLDADAEEAAIMVCDCINTAMGELHPALSQLMIDIMEKGETEAQEKFTKFLMTASPEEQARIMQDVQKMNEFEKVLSKNCDEKMKKYDRYDNNQEFQDKTMAYLANKPECKLTYQIMLSQTTKE
ncbi:MAG: hypothetical protein MUE85_02015 [Microscillaceae bacterium]|jgi:hypothetical protein|nr:hypothetical protein [Microscillaceae bacterium]